MDWVLILASALAFAFAWWGLTRLAAPLFVVAFVAFGLALIVFLSRTLLGIPL